MTPPLAIPATVAGITGGLNSVVTPDELKSVDLEAARDVPGTITPAANSTDVISDAVRQAISDEVARQTQAKLAESPPASPGTPAP